MRVAAISVSGLDLKSLHADLQLLVLAAERWAAADAAVEQTPLQHALLERRQSLGSTPNMTGRRFHRIMEVIPALPWKAKSPSVSRLSKLSIKQGNARGTSEVRRGTSSIHFHCPVPWSSSHIGPGLVAGKEKDAEYWGSKKKSTQTLICTKFFNKPSSHGHSRRKSWTSEPKSVFSCGSCGGKKLFDA